MHLFILAATNIHTFPFLHYLTDICGVKRNHIRVLFYDINSEVELQPNYDLKGISIYYSAQWSDPSIYQNVKNITISSLSSVKGQAGYVKNIIDSGLANYSQLIIRITDDEVDRWTSLYTKHGKIVESKGAIVDSSTIAILQHASRFICRYKPWGQQLETIIGRELQVYNTSILVNPFINPTTAEFYENELTPSVRKQVKKSGVIRILIHTKPNPNHIVRDILTKALLPLILHSSGCLGSRSLEVALWWPGRIRDITSLNITLGILLSVAKLKKVKINFSLLNNMPTETYYSFLSSVHVLIAQNRGGLGSMLEASKNGCIIVLQAGSYNEAVYSGYQKLPFITTYNIKNTFNEPIKLLKSNNFESLLNKQKVIATDFFQSELINSKRDILQIYSPAALL